MYGMLTAFGFTPMEDCCILLIYKTHCIPRAKFMQIASA